MSASCRRRAVDFDRSGATRIGTCTLIRSFTIPGLAATFTAALAGLATAKVFSQTRGSDRGAP